MDDYERWKMSWGKLVCPICDSAFRLPFENDKEEIAKYRHCPFCGERLQPPIEEDD